MEVHNSTSQRSSGKPINERDTTLHATYDNVEPTTQHVDQTQKKVVEHESDFETWENETKGTTCLKQDRVHGGFSYDRYMSQDQDNENTADESEANDNVDPQPKQSQVPV